MQEEAGIFPGVKGEAPGMGGRVTGHTHWSGEAVTDQGNEGGTHQPTVCPLSSALWVTRMATTRAHTSPEHLFCLQYIL